MNGGHQSLNVGVKWLEQQSHRPLFYVFILAQRACLQPAGLTTTCLNNASYTLLTIEIHITKFIWMDSIPFILLPSNTS